MTAAPLVVGRKMNRLTLRRYVPGQADKRSKAAWVCDCACGTTDVVVQASDLRLSKVKSCGCLRRELAHAERMPAMQAARS